MKKKKLMAIAAVAVPIALLGALWYSTIYSLKGIGEDDDWIDEAE